MNTLRIAEGRSTTQSLTEEQALALDHLGGVLSGERRWWGSATGQGGPQSVFRLTRLYGGTWQVDVGNVVGVVGLPGLTLIIEPKIGMSHFTHLLARSNGAPRVDASPTGLAAAPDLHRLVIEWFVAELDTLFRAGLVKDYVHTTDQLAYVRGRIALASTSRSWLRGRVVADCEFDDFTEDTPVNEYLATAVQVAVRSAWITERPRARLAYAARELPPPPPERPPAIDIGGLPPRYRHYERALKYACDIMNGVGRSMELGTRLGGTFVLNSAAVVEDGIRTVLADGLRPVRVVKTGGRYLLPAFVSVNPDLEIGPPPFTGDVKYKVGDRGWNRQDLAQAVLFAAAYKSSHAIVTDFVTQDLPNKALNVGAIQVSRLRWLIGDQHHPEESERRFVEAAQERLSFALQAHGSDSGGSGEPARQTRAGQ